MASSDLAAFEAADIGALQAGLELAMEGIVLLDELGRVVSVNSKAQALAHSALTRLQGADFWDTLPEDIADKQRRQARQALQSAGTHTFVARHVFEDQWVEYCLRAHSRGVVVTLRDVSANHQTLRSLRSSESCNHVLFDAHPQAMWLFDPDSRNVLAANQAAAALYGMPQASLAVQPAAMLFPDAEAAALLTSLPPGDFPQLVRLCTQQKANGERMLVELTCASVQWQLRPAVLVSATDVGARHLADAHLSRLNEDLEIRIEQSTGELQRSRHELDAFNYALSHEFKSPLHVVDGFAATLAERYASALDEQGRHYLARIQASTRQLARLVDDLRTLTDLPRRTVVPELVDLNPLCRRLMDELCKPDPAQIHELEMSPTLPLVCDTNLIAIALACLLDNAWKFTSKKVQRWIKVGLMPGKAPGEVVLYVSDNGAGFDAAYSDKLFTAFERLHSSADFPGSGLGLAIVKRVAQMHGGDAWGVSADREGASFFMSLPQALPGPAGPAVNG